MDIEIKEIPAEEMEKLPVEQQEELKKYLDAITEAETKRLELEGSLKTPSGKSMKIKKLVLIDRENPESKPCIAFFQAATTETKMHCIDLNFQGYMKACKFYFNACVLKEHSDSRVFLKDNDDDFYYISALNWCGEQITSAQRIVKKK